MQNKPENQGKLVPQVTTVFHEDHKAEEQSWPDLHKAVRDNLTGRVRSLLASRTSIDMHNSNHWTALQIAAWYNTETEILRTLLDARANALVCCKRSGNLLHLIGGPNYDRGWERIEMAELVLARVPDRYTRLDLVMSRNLWDQTPLDVSESRNNESYTRFLRDQIEQWKTCFFEILQTTIPVRVLAELIFRYMS